ncbi:MAG: glycosyltransferase [Desulfobacteraceae bacterium]|nr:glycosyltransferase [Desulfobacteraceae bacterium]
MKTFGKKFRIAVVSYRYSVEVSPTLKNICSYLYDHGFGQVDMFVDRLYRKENYRAYGANIITLLDKFLDWGPLRNLSGSPAEKKAFQIFLRENLVDYDVVFAAEFSNVAMLHNAGFDLSRVVCLNLEGADSIRHEKDFQVEPLLHCAFFIAPSKERADDLQKYLGANLDFEYLPVSLRPVELKGRSHCDELNIIYSGYFAEWAGLLEFLEAYRKSSAYEYSSLLLQGHSIGTDGYLEAVRKDAEIVPRLKIDTSFYEDKDHMDLLAKQDVGIAFYKNLEGTENFTNLIFSSGKIASYLWSGLAVLTNVEAPETKYPPFIYVRDFSEHEIKQGLHYVRDNRKLFRDSAYELASKKYNFDTCIKRIVERVSKLCENRLHATPTGNSISLLSNSAKAAYGCGEVEVAKKIARTVVKFTPEFTQAKEFLANLSMSNSSSFLTREPKMFSHGQTSPALLNIEQFEKQINPVTWQRHDKILQWAHSCEAAPERFELPELYENSDDPAVRQGFELTGKVKQQFRGRYKHLKDLRILVHIPSLRFSPAGYSLFTNMAQGLEFIGIPVRMLGWNETIDKLLYEFRPTVFLTSDHEGYLSRINWDSVKKYRESNTLRIGLTASIEEYGNTALQERLLWAKQHRVDFYYSFRCPEYLRQRTEYRPFFENGYNIFSVEFGANPLIHYPVPGIERDLSYVFLASINPDKWPRYFSYLSGIFSKYPGFLDGPGWSFIKTMSESFSKDRYLYARAKVGLNLHLDEQINWANELNERTYILAACGVPQLLDDPKLLPYRFNKDGFFVANTPSEYTALFAYILNNPVEAQKKALIAQREVFTKHTWFHRAEGLVLDLMRNYFPKSQQHGLLYNSDLHSQVNRKICGRVARIGGSVKQLLEYKSCEVQDINLMDGGFGRVPPNSNTIIIDMHNTCHEPWLMNRYDCSISSNVIEHSYNPVALLLNFYFITKKGGYQFHAIPNCRYTYDSYRKPTSLAHLIDDFEKMTDKSDTSHNEDYIQSAIIKDGWQREFHKKYPLTYPYIHFHVFDEYNTKELMEFIFQDVMIDVIKTRQFSDVLVLFRNVLNPKFVGKYRNLINQYSQRIPMSDDNVLNKIERGNHISSISEFQSEPET